MTSMLVSIQPGEDLDLFTGRADKLYLARKKLVCNRRMLAFAEALTGMEALVTAHTIPD